MKEEEEYYINFEVPLLKNKNPAEYKNLIRESFLNEANRIFNEENDIEPSDRPMSIDIEVYYTLAESTPKYIIDELKYGDDDYVPQSNPDMGKVVKCVIDALNGVAYINKKQIYGLTCNSFFDFKNDTNSLRVSVNCYEKYKTIDDLKRGRREDKQFKKEYTCSFE